MIDRCAKHQLAVGRSPGGTAPARLEAKQPAVRSWNADGTDAGAGVNFSLDIGAMDLSGAFFDISQNGLIFSKSSLTIASAALKDVSMGQVGIGSGVFDGVKNGSMGSFGATNIVISNPRIAVSGM